MTLRHSPLPWRLDRNTWIVYASDGSAVAWVDDTASKERFEKALADCLFYIECVNRFGGSAVSVSTMPIRPPLDAKGIPMDSQQGKASTS